MIAGTAAVLTAAVLTLGGAFRSGGAAAAPDRLPSGVAEELQRGFAAGDTEAEIAGLQGELRLRPRNVKALETLGLAYLQRVRETGDASYYPKADGILHEALGIQPRDLIATAGLGPARARPPPVSPGAHARPSRTLDLADDRGRVRRDRRRRDRARALPAGVRGVQSHDGAEAERRVVRARLVRTRAARRHRRRGARDGARVLGRSRRARAVRVDASPARAASALDRARRCRCAQHAHRARVVPGLPVRARRPRAVRGCARAPATWRARSRRRPWLACHCRSTFRSSATSTARSATALPRPSSMR